MSEKSCPIIVNSLYKLYKTPCTKSKSLKVLNCAIPINQIHTVYIRLENSASGFFHTYKEGIRAKMRLINHIKGILNQIGIFLECLSIFNNDQNVLN